MILTKDQATQVWNILAECCQAGDDVMRDQFIHHSATTDRLEFRFCGSLGFGGKIYVEELPRVSCYPEDETPERLSAIAKANERLCLLWGDWEVDRV